MPDAPPPGEIMVETRDGLVYLAQRAANGQTLASALEPNVAEALGLELMKKAGIARRFIGPVHREDS